MTVIDRQQLEPVQGTYNLSNYQEAYESFTWDSISQHFSWQQTGLVNMAYECIDRHVEDGFGDKIALHYVNGDEEVKYSFREVQEKTNHLATVLKHHGIKKGDFVFIFLPKHPDCYFAMIAAIKLGAIAGPLFEAFMEEAVRDRIADCEGKYIITDADLLQRVPKQELPSLEKIFITEGKQSFEEGVISLEDEMEKIPAKGKILEWVDLEHGLNIHYTSGSTGKPKGIIHAHRAMIHQYQTGKWVLDIKEDDVYWCTAHPGWVTGTVYGIFAPWLNRATIVVNGGRFDAKEWYKTLESTKVSVWYSAPTAYRMLMAEGENLQKQYDLSAVRHMLSVGEPLNPEVIYWGMDTIGKRIHDTWWMTETGAQLIVNLPSAPIKPGSMGRPFPGIEIAILDDNGDKLPAGTIGHLAIQTPWPGLMREVWKNKEKYQSYFPFNGWYVSGDLAIQDEDGYVFFQGRSDDMINSSGERIGPFEVESKLIEHPAVAEAGVIGKPDPLRGEIVKAFIILRKGFEATDDLLDEIRKFVKTRLAAHAAPREIEIVSELPKTKISGKILRRELKARELQKLQK
ncbi:acetate--CoA ligase [Cytobacillus purgationiresistens]|uniref:acetate--CoA ligase n=1 Tax=Cytobacillus purgationiresistens TaxID=863449 RepID=A0ABU0AQU0_9BACI|nr:acetate--CoA ligase [Cytobacillus purgationiresistens]MDQ0273643.1 acetyl-CoA synthetase [Cytobacillus purgationiresistens]